MLVSFLCFNKIYCLEYSCFKWENKGVSFSTNDFPQLIRESVFAQISCAGARYRAFPGLTPRASFVVVRRL